MNYLWADRMQMVLEASRALLVGLNCCSMQAQRCLSAHAMPALWNTAK
jgi:hypothetical protein